jgi:hypothetical protein
MMREEVHAEFLWGKLRERNHFKDLYVCGRIILKRIFKKYYMLHGLN